MSISRHGPKPRGRAFVRCDTSRAAQIEAALESPRRVVEIAAIIGHPADRLSANLRDLLRQGRIQRIAWGQYVRAGGRT